MLYTCVCAYDHTRKTALVTPPLRNFRMELRNPWRVLQDLLHLVLSCSSNIRLFTLTPAAQSDPWVFFTDVMSPICSLQSYGHVWRATCCSVAAKMKTKAPELKNSQLLDCLFLSPVPGEQLVTFEAAVKMSQQLKGFPGLAKIKTISLFLYHLPSMSLVQNKELDPNSSNTASFKTGLSYFFLNAIWSSHFDASPEESADWHCASGPRKK